MRECIDVMADALADLTRGAFLQPLRMVVRPPEARGVMAMMPADNIYFFMAVCFIESIKIKKDKTKHISHIG